MDLGPKNFTGFSPVHLLPALSHTRSGTSVVWATSWQGLDKVIQFFKNSGGFCFWNKVSVWQERLWNLHPWRKSCLDLLWAGGYPIWSLEVPSSPNYFTILCYVLFTSGVFLDMLKNSFFPTPQHCLSDRK